MRLWRCVVCGLEGEGGGARYNLKIGTALDGGRAGEVIRVRVEPSQLVAHYAFGDGRHVVACSSPAHLDTEIVSAQRLAEATGAIEVSPAGVDRCG